MEAAGLFITSNQENIMSFSDRGTDSISFPSTFETREIETNGTTIHTRVGGRGPAVVLLHGFGTTGDMWVPLASVLAADHTVIVPDLRGLGLSSKPAGGYDKKTQSHDVAGVMEALGVSRADFVTHDIGNMVGYAFAVGFPDRVTCFVPIDAPLPGVGAWEQIVQDPRMWQFGFGGPDMERLVAGRERIYLDRFWNEFALHPERFDEAKRQHYAALYAMPGAIRTGFTQFAAFGQDALEEKSPRSIEVRSIIFSRGGPHTADAFRRGAWQTDRSHRLAKNSLLHIETQS